MRFGQRLAVPLCLLVALTAADDGSRAPVWGHVVDGTTGAPVADAVVRMGGAAAETRTDEAGRFDFGLRDFGEDSLTVSHEGYRSVQILLGGEEEAPIDVRLSPNPVAIPDALSDQMQAFALTSGGSVWRQEDFWQHLPRSGHPLDLLLSSGMVDVIDVRRGPGVCIVLAGAEGCATLWLHDAPVPNTTFDSYLPTQVAGFVVVPEGGFTQSLGRAGGTPGNGIIAVFILFAS